MSTRFNADPDAYNYLFARFIELNQLFRSQLLDTVVGKNGNFTNMKTYGDFMIKAVDYSGAIENHFNLMYDALSNLYEADPTYSSPGWMVEEIATAIEKIQDADNLPDLLNQGRYYLYVPLLKICWEFNEDLKLVVLSAYRRYRDARGDLAMAYEAIRGMERNILKLLQTMAI